MKYTGLALAAIASTASAASFSVVSPSDSTKACGLDRFGLPEPDEISYDQAIFPFKPFEGQFTMRSVLCVRNIGLYTLL